MSRLSDIETAIDSLPPAEKQELLLFLAARLRAHAGELPPPRKFTTDEVRSWVAEEEAAMRRFRDEHAA